MGSSTIKASFLKKKGIWEHGFFGTDTIAGGAAGADGYIYYSPISGNVIQPAQGNAVISFNRGGFIMPFSQKSSGTIQEIGSNLFENAGTADEMHWCLWEVDCQTKIAEGSIAIAGTGYFTDTGLDINVPDEFYLGIGFNNITIASTVKVLECDNSAPMIGYAGVANPVDEVSWVGVVASANMNANGTFPDDIRATSGGNVQGYKAIPYMTIRWKP